MVDISKNHIVASLYNNKGQFLEQYEFEWDGDTPPESLREGSQVFILNRGYKQSVNPPRYRYVRQTTHQLKVEEIVRRPRDIS